MENNKMSLTAQEAKQISTSNEKRKTEIKNLIETGEMGIKSAYEKGRRYSTIYAGYVDGTKPEYQEVLEHFQKLGYKLEHVYGTNVFEIRW